jgi:dihydroorotase
MRGLETTFAVMNTIGIPLPVLVQQLTVTGREIAHLPLPQIVEGATACLTLFQPNEAFVWPAITPESASKNNAFAQETLTGRVVGIINKGICQLNPQ